MGILVFLSVNWGIYIKVLPWIKSSAQCWSNRENVLGRTGAPKRWMALGWGWSGQREGVRNGPFPCAPAAATVILKVLFEVLPTSSSPSPHTPFLSSPLPGLLPL